MFVEVSTLVAAKRYNGDVHRAAANINGSKSRAARGSVCNVLLSDDPGKVADQHNRAR